MKRIGMGLVGAGFVGPHHIDAVRRLGTSTSSRSPAAARRRRAEGGGARRAEGLRQLRGAARRPDVHVVHNATPNYLHYPVNAAAHRQGQARRLGQAAGDDGRPGEEAARPGARGRRRPRRDVQLSRQSARPAGAPRDRPRRHRHAAVRRTATTCRTGCSRTPTTRGGSSRTRAAPRRRSATSARTGATWRSTSPGCAITHVLGDITTVIPKRKKPTRIARGVCRPRAGRGSNTSTSRSRISRRCSCGSTTARRARSRSARCAPATRTTSSLEVCGSTASVQLAAGAAERAVDRPSRRGERDPAEGSRRSSTRPRAATRTCPAAIRKRGPTRSAT